MGGGFWVAGSGILRQGGGSGSVLRVRLRGDARGAQAPGAGHGVGARRGPSRSPLRRPLGPAVRIERSGRAGLCGLPCAVMPLEPPVLAGGPLVWAGGLLEGTGDQAESLILAQNERWRRA